MPPHNEASYDAFHGREAATDAPRPIGTFESLRNLMGAVWRHRGDLSSNGVAAAKDIVPELPLNDPIGMKLSNEVMHMLWGSMLHPPSSYRGAKFQYRSADGSYNSMIFPDIGKGGQPYAKSIQAQRAVHAAKPDVGDLFDLLMARNDDGIESTTGISSLLLYQATIVIHDVFRTNDTDRNISDTSSYLDLSPLYGADEAQQKTVRTMRDGLLKPDTFAEHRLLNQPPGVSIFLIMYNRFHNYVAKQLKEINENNKFGLPDDLPDGLEKAKEKQDEDLFQTARLITCGLYAQIAIHDYLRCLMMQHAKDTAWTLDPRREYNGLLDKETVARGQGNMVSVEFNLLYRFHSALSRRDGWWSEQLFVNSLKPITPGETDAEKEQKIKNGETSAKTMRAALEAINATWKAEYEKRAEAKYFPVGFDTVVHDYEPPVPGQPFKPKYAFNRVGDYFDDAQMVAELVRCMEDPMCSFGSNQIPKVFKSIEMLGLLQSRKWEVCTLNEFRRFFGMKPHARFEDINTDPKICNTLRDLYVDVESVELYPGYLCEGNNRNVDPDAKLPNNGSSALWRGIFSDAVTLVRSDRFYTTEWNVDSITAYGMREVTSDPTINKGGLLYKLCHRAFPGYFKYNSLHLWEPYYTAERNLMLAYQQGKLKDLDLEGLEYKYDGDLEWKLLNLHRNSEGVVADAFFQEVKKKETMKQPKNLRVRRICVEGEHPNYRGEERAEKVSTTKLVIGAYEGRPEDTKSYGDYDKIKKHILGGKDGALWVNPANVAAYDIPKGALRQILTNQYNNKRYDHAMKVLGHCMNMNKEGHIDTSRFRAYFLHMADAIRLREQRKLQKAPSGDQIYQLDIVADYAIPIIARFFADWLGIWDRVKTVEHPNREFSENKIYELFDNCQDYLSWDSDQTKGMKRRQLYIKSIKQLKALADEGVLKSSAGLLWWRNFFRSYGADAHEVVEVRKLAVHCTQALLYDGFSFDEVSSIMLQFALDSAHKVVHNVTEVLAFFIDPKNTSGRRHSKHWATIQQAAWSQGSHAHKLVSKYVLEAMRLSPSVKLARQYIGETNNDSASGLYGIEKGQVVLLDISAASQNTKVFPSPAKFNPDRPTKHYLIHGEDVDVDDRSRAASFGKQLALAYLTSLVQHASTLRRLRVAHEQRGRLKRIALPSGLPGYPASEQLSRYASPEWDALLPFPCSWEVRFDDRYDGTRDGIFGDEEGDNADTGNSMDNVYVQVDLSVQPADAEAAPSEAAPSEETVITTEEKAARTSIYAPLDAKRPQSTVTEIPTPSHWAA